VLFGGVQAAFLCPICRKAACMENVQEAQKPLKSAGDTNIGKIYDD
jgi:hypothetical protein